jgi:hypothetical protein
MIEVQVYPSSPLAKHSGCMPLGDAINIILEAQHAAYRKQNREKLKAQHAAYYEQNREKLKAQHAAYRKQNREKVTA